MKILLYILLGIGLLVAILHFMAPKTYHVERKIIVSANIDTVFKSLCSLKDQQVWSPWGSKDPNMTIEYNGIDGEIGSISHWVGNKEVGEGEQEITKIEPTSYIETELRFLKPFESTSTGFFTIRQVAEGTEVTWGFKGNNTFPTTLMMVFMNIDKAIGPDFEKGMADFKSFIEK
ncbi:SRPBCC family protein [Labilibaculum manganireducens]|uniref:Polyketide cyclase n=1 Tax=Labilibaculum manganireducens TaxID=1940525 RepID=A0A2N3HSH1_9BACT|nr:SRPBCC family protein [Labilibaculum manganireducens]PKQ60993.1 polyketide cyclase [Labilibaculum manganireducens]